MPSTGPTPQVQDDPQAAVDLLTSALGAVIVEDWRPTRDGAWRDTVTGMTRPEKP